MPLFAFLNREMRYPKLKGHLILPYLKATHRSMAKYRRGISRSLFSRGPWPPFCSLAPAAARPAQPHVRVPLSELRPAASTFPGLAHFSRSPCKVLPGLPASCPFLFTPRGRAAELTPARGGYLHWPVKASRMVAAEKCLPCVGAQGRAFPSARPWEEPCSSCKSQVEPVITWLTFLGILKSGETWCIMTLLCFCK